jgi:hypothetical protein
MLAALRDDVRPPGAAVQSAVSRRDRRSAVYCWSYRKARSSSAQQLHLGRQVHPAQRRGESKQSNAGSRDQLAMSRSVAAARA